MQEACKCTTAAAAPVHACIVSAAWVGDRFVASPVPGVCALPVPASVRLSGLPLLGWDLPDLPARSPKVAPWLDGGLSLTSDSPPFVAVDTLKFDNASASPPAVAVDTLVQC